MKKPAKEKRDKEVYRELRTLSVERLRERMALFDRAGAEQRRAEVALVRAVGVVFSESKVEEVREFARLWMRSLLSDPDEKIRRYAMTALPKIGAGGEDESKVLELLRAGTSDREKNAAARTLEKIGGAATLQAIPVGADWLHTTQKLKARLARAEAPSEIRMDAPLGEVTGFRIHLRGRFGLEEIVRDECEDRFGKRGAVRVLESSPGLVALSPTAPFCLNDLFKLRCFGVLGFALNPARDSMESIATAITSPLAKRILQTFTQGPIRYRLDFADRGHQRAAVRELANRVYAIDPELLNSPQAAPWTIAIHRSPRGAVVELCPRIAPDPRYAYRQRDVPAASQPPLAACLARVAGKNDGDVVWDPFCGSGLELIERALLGGVRALYGTDLDPAAIAIAQKNFAAAGLRDLSATFIESDFRNFLSASGLKPGSLSLVITNPPLGKRVPVPNMRGLIDDLFRTAAYVLKPGGRLVFVNPLRIESPDRSLKLQFRRTFDLGGFNCRLEKYVKAFG